MSEPIKLSAFVAGYRPSLGEAEILVEIAQAALSWRSARDRYSQYAAARFRLNAALNKVTV